MITQFAGGRVFDPANGLAGDIRDLFVEDGRIVATPPGGRGDRVGRSQRARRHAGRDRHP